MNHVDLNLNCILIILTSKYSHIGILMQRKDVILEWIFLPHKLSKKIKRNYVEMVSELILTGKLRHCQLVGIDHADILVPYSKDKINKFWEASEPWKSTYSALGEINNNYPIEEEMYL